jgi:hypothetical protein
MNDTPALFIQFDPDTWQITAIFFKSSTDEETKRLTEILSRGVKLEMMIPAGSTYNA